MIKVIGIIVRTSDKVYNPGDIIFNMSPEDEESLIDDGYAERVGEAGEKPPTKDKIVIPPAEELIKLIEETDSIEDIEKILVDELANKRRKTVLAAASAKIETLSSSEVDSEEDDSENDDAKATNTEDTKSLVGNFNASDMVVTGAK
jgi:hypothetical protein